MRRWKVFSAAAAVALAVSFNMMAILAQTEGFPKAWMECQRYLPQAACRSVLQAW